MVSSSLLAPNNFFLLDIWKSEAKVKKNQNSSETSRSEAMIPPNLVNTWGLQIGNLMLDTTTQYPIHVRSIIYSYSEKEKTKLQEEMGKNEWW